MKRIFLALYSALLAMAVQAQTAPTVQITCAPTTAVSPASVALSWSSTGAASCTAGGGWSGTKATSGTQSIADLRASATYSLTCTAAPTLGSARLSWTPPTQNTDGTALANLAGYRIIHGTSAAALTQTIQVANASVTAYTVDNLETGTHYFAVRAYTTTGTESAASNVVNKAVRTTPGASVTGQCAITIDTRPQPPSNLQVIEATAHEIEVDWSVPRFVAGPTRGRIALGTPCLAGYAIAGAYYGVPRETVKWDGADRPLYPVARCGLVPDCSKCRVEL